MSLRIDASEWISGSLLIGETGFGVLAENIPSTGTSGASYLYNDVILPADNGKEICGRITSWPSAGTLFAYEDGSFGFTGAPDGAYSFDYQLYVDGVATGASTTVDLTVGVLTLRPGLLTNSNTFYSPTVSPGSVTLTPALFTNANTFYSPVVNLDGAQTLVPALLTNANTFFASAVSVGAVVLAPALFANTSAFFSPVVSVEGNQVLTPALFANANTFFDPVVTGGEVVVPVQGAKAGNRTRANTYRPSRLQASGRPARIA